MSIFIFLFQQKTDCRYGISVFMEPDPDRRGQNMGNKKEKGEEIHFVLKVPSGQIGST
jgi:hypothetical protein